MIHTVRGEKEPKDLGITMCHEHLSIDLSPVRKNTDSTYCYSKFILNEVEKAKMYGVKSFVEVTCNDMGRNIKDLLKISEETNTHIIAATGFYINDYHSEDFKRKSIDEIAKIFISDLTKGIEDTEIKAGVIGEVASSLEMAESERKVLCAAAIAQKEVGCAITTHCQLGRMGDKQADIFESYQVNPDKVILGHIDLSNDIDYMISLLDRGFNIEFDTIGKIVYLSDEERAERLIHLLDQGYGDKILLSQDISRKSYFTELGYFGFTTVMKKFIPMLVDRGVKQEDVDKMLIHNPARIFSY
ncbi:MULTISPECIES: phosphotriesterase [Terrabacteria group]|uniref:phosphotriesterase family protein n=1 Tax=Bacillati TaxID=1783272 RepID=UPI001C6E023E|nr:MULTISPECIES: phosphotriesterase-related protein [Terrabacteria group]MBW9212986.1 phosphotriesterase-related protein [Trueperella sp. zg.1013]